MPCLVFNFATQETATDHATSTAVDNDESGGSGSGEESAST